MISDGGASDSGKAAGNGKTKTRGNGSGGTADRCPQPAHLRESTARSQAVVWFQTREI